VEIGASTRLLAVLGDPVGHSLSPLMHNAAIHCMGLDAVYVGLRVPAAALPTVLTTLSTVGAAGNVTVPHKEAVEGLLARKTELCTRAGACNTFWTEHGVLVGDNTDVAGIRAALRALGVDGGGRWLVLGTGGAARAVLVAAAEAKADLCVRSRDPARAREFADWGAARGMAVHVAHGPLDVDVAINATPLGLQEADAMPIEPRHLNGLQVALDLVYARGETRWVRTLRAAGVAAADGREMLVRQGAAAFARFFPGRDAPVEVMRAAVGRALRA
jgi:shikimate dehydrogenase